MKAIRFFLLRSFALTVLALLALPALSAPALAQTTKCLPSCDVTDGRFFAIAGDDLITLSDTTLVLEISVPAASTSFQVGFFDGDGAELDVLGLSHWDTGVLGIYSYTLFADPTGDGTGTEVVELAPGFPSVLSTVMPDNAWIDFTISNTPSAQAPSGNYFYRLAIELLDPSLVTLNAFKVRTSAIVTGLTIEPLAQPFSYIANWTGIDDITIVHPAFPSPTPTTYDGTFRFFFDVPETQSEIAVWDGDFDRGNVDGTNLDTDDPDTPAEDPDNPGATFPPWATADANPEGIAMGGENPSTTGNPADNQDSSGFGAFVAREPTVAYDLVFSDGQVFTDDNPSGNQEWEQFRLSTTPGDPAADATTTSIPPGTYEFRVRGVDMLNLNAILIPFRVICVDDTGAPCVILRPYRVGDTVFSDSNGNGVQDSGEPGIEGVTLELHDFAGVLLRTTTTDASGKYTFEVEAGTWEVRVAASNFNAGGQLEGATSTTGNTFTRTVTTDNVLTYDFGYRGAASIGDYVWYDANGNGLQDEPATAGLAGVKVRLTEAGPDNAFGTADDVTFPTQTTTAGGLYRFNNLVAGTYRVDVDETTLRAGLALTTGNEPLTVNLAANQTYNAADFGYRGNGSLGDTVWNDVDGNGAQNGTEAGINGVTVNLSGDIDGDGINEVVASTVTATVSGVPGRYTFGGLPAGTYTVTVSAMTLPPDYVQTYDLDGTATMHTAVASLNAGQSRDDVDFGYREMKSVKPILECVIKNSSSSYTAYFGYDNQNSSTVTIPIGPDNKFSPAPDYRGQPTMFSPGRSPLWPDAAFSVSFNGSNLTWTLAGQSATASSSSTPCARQVYIEKKWYDDKGKLLSGKPSSLSSSFKITATSTLGTATCTYPSGSSTLSCTYANNPPATDNNGLWVAEGTTYTVTESNMPSGSGVIFGAGQFSAANAAQCVPGKDGIKKRCSHVVRNFSTAPTCASKADQDPTYGPDASIHAFWLPGIGTDFVFTPSGSFTTSGQGTAQLTGTVKSTANSNNGFNVTINFTGFQKAGTPKKELRSGAYVENGGPIDASTWWYYTGFTGTLTGIGNYAGATLTVSLTGGPFQVGVGASGKNLTFGASGWFLWSVTRQPSNGTHLQSSGQGDININLFTCPPAPSNPGTGTIGYWKNHSEAWPVSSIKLGNKTYTKSQAISLLGQSSNGDKSIDLAKQLIAAKLNVTIGNDASCIQATIDAADNWLKTYPVGSGVSGSSSAWSQASPWHSKLDDYNNGELCAPHRD